MQVDQVFRLVINGDDDGNVRLLVFFHDRLIIILDFLCLFNIIPASAAGGPRIFF